MQNYIEKQQQKIEKLEKELSDLQLLNANKGLDKIQELEKTNSPE